MTDIAFDIETGPLDLEQLKQVLPPFDAASLGQHPGEFDPASVKTGNLKDQSKIDAKIADAREAHTLAVKRYEESLATGEPAYWQEQQSRAALSAMTGQVLAIGYAGERVLLDHISETASEKQLLIRFWNQFNRCRESGRRMVGWNIEGFDLPFLCQRSAILGVTVPEKVFTEAGWTDFTFVDLMKRWSRPTRTPVKLDTVARACGLQGKPSDESGKAIDGSQFARLFFETPEVALDYLKCDLQMVVSIGSRLGLQMAGSNE
jgi:hypothetical protein